MPAVAGPEIERLIQLLARLPGIGPRSARRAALHLIKKREALMTPLSSALQVAIEKIQDFSAARSARESERRQARNSVSWVASSASNPLPSIR